MSLSDPDRYVVIGHPVEHSLSPGIHARFAALTGEAVSYGRLLAPLDGFEACVRTFAAQGGKGANVTVPFKFEAFNLASVKTPRARLAGAANTLKFGTAANTEGWAADNTDGAGLVTDITRNAGVDLQGRDVLLLGAGGAAAGVLGPLLEERPRRVVVANRNVARAQALVRRHADPARDHGVDLQSAVLDDCGRGFGVVINGTAASLLGQTVPLSAAVFTPGALAVDLMYGPCARPFLDWAAAQGAVVRDGLGMLVEQAAISFEFWRGVRPEGQRVLAELRAATP